MRVSLLPLLLAIAAGCGGAAPKPVAPPPVAEEPARSPVVSWDILQREPVANEAEVRHILIGWRDVGADPAAMDPRALARSKAQAEAEVQAVLAKLVEGTGFEALMAEVSEDPGSARSGHSYQVSPAEPLAIEFKQLSLRLNPGELGVCQSTFGFHIIKRIK
jgi:peptidyl-prolyl cis-trans isomerase D